MKPRDIQDIQDLQDLQDFPRPVKPPVKNLEES